MSPGYISPWHIYSLNENVVGLHNARSEKVAFLRRISWRAFPLSNYPGRHVARDKYPQRHVAPGKAGKCDGIVVNVVGVSPGLRGADFQHLFGGTQVNNSNGNHVNTSDKNTPNSNTLSGSWMHHPNAC
ncbi:hypothetical protein Tco_1059700, partial [Tanacetum coccineum]